MKAAIFLRFGPQSEGRDTVVVALTWVDGVSGDPGAGGFADPHAVGSCRQDHRLAAADRRADRFRARMSLRGIVSALELGGLALDDVTLHDVTSEQPAFAGANVGEWKVL